MGVMFEHQALYEIQTLKRSPAASCYPHDSRGSCFVSNPINFFGTTTLIFCPFEIRFYPRPFCGMAPSAGNIQISPHRRDCFSFDKQSPSPSRDTQKLIGKEICYICTIALRMPGGWQRTGGCDGSTDSRFRPRNSKTKKTVATDHRLPATSSDGRLVSWASTAGQGKRFMEPHGNSPGQCTF